MSTKLQTNMQSTTQCHLLVLCHERIGKPICYSGPDWFVVEHDKSARRRHCLMDVGWERGRERERERRNVKSIIWIWSKLKFVTDGLMVCTHQPCAVRRPPASAKLQTQLRPQPQSLWILTSVWNKRNVFCVDGRTRVCGTESAFQCAQCAQWHGAKYKANATI